jgi:catechol 2,3-dioxygenase-like lactoylglutathione lyase family enzyme
MRDKARTRSFYESLGFSAPNDAYPDYLMMKRDLVEIHFFLHPKLNPAENYGMVYIRVNDAAALYQECVGKNLPIHGAGHLEDKPWRQREFSMLDPDTNLLTFGQSLGN